MSKIKVDTIESRNGTLTVGAAGDTVVYKSGSIPNSSLENSAITINGSSVSLGGSVDVGGGAIDWQTTAKTTAFTAVAGEGYFVDTTSSAITATLPASPSAGDQVAFKDYAATFGTNQLNIARNGSNVQGDAKDAFIDTDRASVVLVYVDATKGWLFTNESNVGNLLISVSDAPTIGTATATGETTATVTFTAPVNNGGSPITQYTATSSPGGITGTLNQAGSGTITVSGLTTGTSYTFTVTATNAVGASDPSAASNSITMPSFVAATGGTETTDGDFKVHTFTSSGTFTVSSAGNPAGSSDVEYLVIAGGGSGGKSDRGGGGGGAGGYRTATGLPVSVQGYPITVGAGGPAPQAPDATGSSGSNSVFSSITSSGGGAGGGNFSGLSGGSGGGCSHGPGSAGSGNSPSVSPPQGNPGGLGQNGPSYNGGGGGGASASGSPGSSGSTGGNGSPSTITGSDVTRAGGGGGGRQPGNAGAGGAGGGGGPSYGDAGDVNTGSGGVGGTGRSAGQQPAGNGGSGVVIIRYKFQ